MYAGGKGGRNKGATGGGRRKEGERDRHGGDGRWIKRAGMWRGEGRGIRIRGNDTSCRGMIPATSSTGLQPTEGGILPYRLSPIA